MSNPLKQHLIDPEICIRCYTCEAACPVDAITHNDDNVVVDYEKCNCCMDCISPCPTGSIDEWRVVTKPYTLEEQFEWIELPEQDDVVSECADTTIEALDDAVAALLSEAHKGAGGKAKAPTSASKPTINLFNLGKPAFATVQGNFRLTAENADSDVRHIILDFKDQVFPVLEGQSIGITPPGRDENDEPYLPRLYSIASPRDGERPNTNNLALTVKREENGICSNYVCNLAVGDEVKITGPFGATFLMPSDNRAKIMMICTGTGSAPFRGFTMRRQRTDGETGEPIRLFFGARTPESLPYFGPLKKISGNLLQTHFAFSRVENKEKCYVQDVMREESAAVASYLMDPNAYIYICGLRAMEEGVEAALGDIAKKVGLDWSSVRQAMRENGRYHVETY